MLQGFREQGLYPLPLGTKDEQSQGGDRETSHSCNLCRIKINTSSSIKGAVSEVAFEGFDIQGSKLNRSG